MGNDAVQAIVRARGRDYDHLALRLRKPRIAQHQRVVIRKERAEFVRPVREREEDVRNETCLLLHFEHPRADILGQVFELRDGITTDFGGGHGRGDFQFDR